MSFHCRRFNEAQVKGVISLPQVQLDQVKGVEIQRARSRVLIQTFGSRQLRALMH